MKKVFSAALVAAILCSCFVFAACSSEGTTNESNSAGKTVIDMTGREVQVPAQAERYVVLWTSFTSVTAMLDDCKSLAGVPQIGGSSYAWFYEIYPEAADIAAASESMSVEEIVALNADVVFWQNPRNQELADELINLGIAAVNISFDDYETLKQSVALAAEVIGTDEAIKKAEEYNAALDAVISEIDAKVQAAEEQKTVLNLVSLEGLRADGNHSIANAWITAIGAENVVTSSDDRGNYYLTAEEFIKLNPDVIFSSSAGDAEALYAQAVYSSLNAVVNKAIFTNPFGVFWWNRYSVETILQLKWAANAVYPDVFQYDMGSEIRDFYKTFYDYDISDIDIENMLNGMPPESYSE